MGITRWSTPKSDWLYSLQLKKEKLCRASKNKTGSWLWLRSWSTYCKVSQFSLSVMSHTLWSHGLHHARPPCPSLTSGVYSHSCPFSWWCHPTISSSVVPFPSDLQSFPASGSFQMSQFFTSGSQSIGVSASASVLLMIIQDWFYLGWTGWISLLSKGLSRLFSKYLLQKLDLNWRK